MTFTHHFRKSQHETTSFKNYDPLHRDSNPSNHYGAIFGGIWLLWLSIDVKGLGTKVDGVEVHVQGEEAYLRFAPNHRETPILVLLDTVSDYTFILRNVFRQNWNKWVLPEEKLSFIGDSNGNPLIAHDYVSFRVRFRSSLYRITFLVV